MELMSLFLAAFAVFFITLVAFIRRYKRCPSDKILVVYGKVSGKGLSAKCYHGGASFIWPVIQDYRFLDLTPMAIDINLQGALSLQNIRVNTPSTFTVGISTEPGVMENAAERLLEMDMKRVAELARDIIFGQMRVVLATMPIEEINADRDKLIENISSGVEVELKKVGLRLINVNIQDITDESGYIDALGKEAAARAINEAKIKVAEKERDGSIGAANAERDQRIQVASAGATAVEGENEAGIKVAQSNARRREMEAEAERTALAAEKVKSAQALEEAYVAEEQAERQRAKREEATQAANIVVPAEIEKRRIETLAEAEAEQTRRLKKGEADGLRSVMEAEAEGLLAILTRKASGFDAIVKASRGMPELASLLLVTEQLPKLVEEQVKAISNLKIDTLTVWEGGRGGGKGKTATADFLSGLAGSLPPLHELTRNVGIKLPEYLGTMERASRDEIEDGGGDDSEEPPPAGGGGRGGGAGPVSPGSGGATAKGTSRSASQQASQEGPAAEAAPAGMRSPESVKAAEEPAKAEAKAKPQAKPQAKPEPRAEPEPQAAAASPAAEDGPAEGSEEPDFEVPEAVREKIRSWLTGNPALTQILDKDRDGTVSDEEIDSAVEAALEWGDRAAKAGAAWYYAQGGKWKGPESWKRILEIGKSQPELPVNLDRAKLWLPLAAVTQAFKTRRGNTGRAQR